MPNKSLEPSRDGRRCHQLPGGDGAGCHVARVALAQAGSQRLYDQALVGAECSRVGIPPSSESRRLRNGQTLLRMFRDGLDLFARHTLKPFEKIIHRGAALKILE